MTAAVRTNAAVIPSGGTTSQSIDLDNYDALGGLVGFIIPATFTGASVSFKISLDDVTYQPLNDSSNALVSINVTQGTSYSFKQDVRSLLTPWRFIQIVSASAETPARTITLLKK
jgi:hypothetical protein